MVESIRISISETLLGCSSDLADYIFIQATSASQAIKEEGLVMTLIL